MRTERYSSKDICEGLNLFTPQKMINGEMHLMKIIPDTITESESKKT